MYQNNLIDHASLQYARHIKKRQIGVGETTGSGAHERRNKNAALRLCMSIKENEACRLLLWFVSSSHQVAV